MSIVDPILDFLLERLYEELAWAYDAVSWLVSLGRWGIWRRAALEYVQGGRILEVGCGTGQLLDPLAHGGRWVCGADLSWSMLCQARRNTGQLVSLCQTRAQALPFATATFDTVVSTFPSDYICDASTWAELERVLRPGGQVVVVYGVSVGRRTFGRRLIRLLLTLGRTSGATLRPRWARCSQLRTRHQLVEVEDDHVGLLIAERVDGTDVG